MTLCRQFYVQYILWSVTPACTYICPMYCTYFTSVLVDPYFQGIVIFLFYVLRHERVTSRLPKLRPHFARCWRSHFRRRKLHSPSTEETAQQKQSLKVYVYMMSVLSCLFPICGITCQTIEDAVRIQEGVGLQFAQ